jgi:hypothetical protein
MDKMNTNMIKKDNMRPAEQFWKTGNAAPSCAADKRKQEVFREKISALLAKANRQGTPVVEELMVGPLEASVLLDMSWGNRGGGKRSQRRAASFAKAIDSGEWQPRLGTDLLISSDGQLLDFHHRLKGICTSKSGSSVLVRMQIGVPSSLVGVIDQNQDSRNEQDKFAMRTGQLVTNRVSAVLRSAGRVSGMGDVGNFELLYERFADAWAHLSGFGGNKFSACAWGPILCVYVVNPKKAIEFAEKMSTGANCKDGEPALLARNYLMGKTTAGSAATAACESAVASYIRSHVLKEVRVRSTSKALGIEWIRKLMESGK